MCYSSDLADITFAADNEIIGREEEAKFPKALKYMSDSERVVVIGTWIGAVATSVDPFALSQNKSEAIFKSEKLRI